MRLILHELWNLTAVDFFKRSASLAPPARSASLAPPVSLCETGGARLAERIWLSETDRQTGRTSVSGGKTLVRLVCLSVN